MHEYSVWFPCVTLLNPPCSVILIEQMKLAQLQHLNEELEEVKKEKQLGATAGETQEQ